jgi:RHS repeat-associated protein
VWTAAWLPWGGVQSITGTGALNLRFPGQWFQLETGLHYNWHRSYDPSLGRYTQPDPLGFVDGPSVYGYAGGSPGRYVDPDGRWIWVIPRVVAAACKEFPAICRAIVVAAAEKAACLARNLWNKEESTPPTNLPTGKPFTKEESRDLRDIFGQKATGADEVLRRLDEGTGPTAPPTLSRETVDRYREIAREQIAQGKDSSGVQAKRLLILDRLYGK